MDNPLTKLNLGAKLGPLSRGKWLLIGGGVTGVAYWRHRRNMANVAGATDPTVAGATQDANGNQVQTNGTTTDAGTGPMSMFDPYTSGYNGYGYDLSLGTGGIVGLAPTGGGPIVQAASSQNPASPGAYMTAPPQVTVNYPTGRTAAGRHKSVEAPSKSQRDTDHRRIQRAAHNMKNGRHHNDRHRTNKHDPKVRSSL